MDFTLTVEEEKFVNEVREFLKENPPENFTVDNPDQGNSLGGFSRAFYKKLGEAGYLSLSWDPEYGGEGSFMKEFLLLEQLAYHKAPFAATYLLGTVARRIMSEGTQKAKDELLPQMKNGDLIFWLGYSELQAGSDLLNLKTTAREEGDYFVVNGQKIWSSWAHLSDWVYLLVLTDPEAPRGRGLSLLLVDKKSPGVTVEPVRSLADTYYHNMVYLDNVKVHKDYLLGKKNDGLHLMLAGLEADRFWSRCVKPQWLKGFLDDIVRFLRDDPFGRKIISSKPWVRNALAEFMIEIEVGRLFSYQCASILNQGTPLTYESSVLKYFIEELGVRLQSFLVDAFGFVGTLRESRMLPFAQDLCSYYLWSIPYTAAGGTAEIQKDTIARMRFGLRRPSPRIKKA